MDNHIHLIWQMMAGIEPDAVQRDFMKYTAQKIKKDLIKNHLAVLAHFKVNAKRQRVPVLGKKPLEC